MIDRLAGVEDIDPLDRSYDIVFSYYDGELPGSGIVYTLTVSAAEDVASALSEAGLPVGPMVLIAIIFGLLMGSGLRVLGVLSLVGAQRGVPAWIGVAKPAARTLWLTVAGSFACLAYSFYTNDFTVQYVAQHSNSRLPEIYRFTAGDDAERTLIHKQVTYFLGETSKSDVVLSVKESSEFAWLPLADALKRVRYAKRKRLLNEAAWPSLGSPISSCSRAHSFSRLGA